MFSGKSKLLVLFLSFLFAYGNPALSQSLNREEDNTRSLEMGIQILERYFGQDKTWHISHPETGEKVKGLIHFIEKEPLDSILSSLDESLRDSSHTFVFRLPEDVPDSLSVPGYLPEGEVQKRLQTVDAHLKNKFFSEEITVPVDLIMGIEEKAGAIPPGEGARLMEQGVFQLPDSLQLPDVIPDSLMQSPTDFRRFLKLDSLKQSLIEQQRMAYNDSVVNVYRDSIVQDYRNRRYQEEFAWQKQRLVDSVNFNNYQVLRIYNDAVMAAVNDSIAMVVGELAEYADFVDTTRVSMTNLLGEESSILLRNSSPYFSRVWLKNEQNDSLRLMVKSVDKRTMQLLIDDGVTFSRFKPRETKGFDFSTLNRGVSGLTGVKEKYQVLTPWRIGGDGSVGFTQTYLENWKKGGQSALSLQIILKGYANYARHDGKVKWENSGEIRNGYIRPGGEGAETQKNDDKFEITSRFGVSAFKKWYYSTEFNFETQFFNGYKYPTSANPDPISAFMAPARTFFKLGLDYKPNNNFSLLLSPLTAKNVFVKDTVKIDQTKYGIDEGKRSYWEPGLNTDIFWRKNITPEITYETKYKMFINYLHPFGNLDFNWENQLVMQLTDHINMRMLVHFIYDEKVLFPAEDANGNPLAPKPKLQIREFITVGFTYKLSKQVTRTRRKH
ncbi:Protein of unknown function [Mariniphaga anaerophila]|uniref:DUF3078 domain-containing protein n=1 Tax=Mariniphaga anaerophila TaxID=1484053 RepID=A0A1M4ZPP7_9BACT|nr:DUF3078 domain-containing protein [Mariniphaga anaerophila]SHF20080.1 Protein of unknown function [Mariniphaga anaerophila]